MDGRYLLKISNETRAAIRETRSLGRRGPEFNNVLTELHKAELDGRYIDLETIQHTHLDKALQDVQDPKYVPPAAINEQFPELLGIAQGLEKAWHGRFRDAWFALDQTRMASLREIRMRDIVYHDQYKDTLERWTAREADGHPTNAEFRTGDWWLNLACAHRDGIVGSAIERPTKGLYGVRALPLITGREEIVRDGLCKYVRFGTMADMHFSLMTLVGHTTRVIRGYRLKSKLAPAAGVRYDGIYKIRAYSHKYDIRERKHRLEVTLECQHNQLKHALNVPTPAQLDEWLLFEKHEAEVVKQRHGDYGYTDYRLLKDEEGHSRNR